MTTLATATVDLLGDDTHLKRTLDDASRRMRNGRVAHADWAYVSMDS